MKNVKEGKRRLAIIILSMVLAMAALPFALPGQYGSYAATTVSSWGKLVAAVDAGETDIELSGDIAAGNTITIEGKDVTISGSGTIYVAPKDKYDSMFLVKSGGSLTINEGVDLSAKLMSQAGAQTCPDVATYTADNFTGKVSADGKTYEPKGFFIHVEGGGKATLNGTISDFVTSRQKDTTPRYVAPVVAYGSGATFNIGETGVIKNNLVGYIVDDSKANNDAQSIKMYVKGGPPNVPRVPNTRTQRDNSGKFGNRPRFSDAGIDGGVPGSGITATAGAVVYKDGAKGSIEGLIENNRGDTGGVMASGDKTLVTIKADSTIKKNVGVQFGGGSTTEQGGSIAMTGGTMSENVAWFGGGAVFATENGIDWLLGRIVTEDGISPDFGARKDGQFFMTGGELTRNTAFTRGGAILADSDGVNIQKGKLTYNMGRMLGGAMYVMGDDPNYEYTVQMTGLYVHDNAAVSGEKETWGATPPTGDILGEWGNGWAELNAPLQTKLQAPSKCADAGDILSGTVDGGKAGGNTDDWTDGVGSQGTGGGVWLCAYGNTVFDANAPSKVVITNNWATGAPGAPFNPTGAYHKTLGGSDLADAQNNSVPSTDSRSGIASGSDFHADTGNKGKVSIGNLEPAWWYNENTGEKYLTDISDGRLNLVNKSPDPMPKGDVLVEVYGNLSRHGGGLAANGTFIFGTGTDEATPSASMKIEKEWTGSVNKEPVTIRAKVNTANGKEVVLAEVPLDGVANPPASEFDTIEELGPTGNTWNGKFSFPQTVDTSSGLTKLYTLVYTGPTISTGGAGGFEVTADMELDPLTQEGKTALGAVLREGYKDDIEVLFGEPEYADGSSNPKLVRKTDGKYDYNEISFTFEELKEDPNTNVLVVCNDYNFLASEIDLTNIDFEVVATPHYQTSYDPVTGKIIETTTVNYHIYLFEIPLIASMSNDNWPITEKYVNKKVHEDIVNFDQDFEYDILAYVPETATEFTISDTLVKGLEFADKDGNPTDDPKKAVRAIKVKGANNHKPGEEGTVSDKGLHTNNGNEIDFIAWVPKWGEKYYPDMSINDSTLSVTFDHSTPADNKVFGINGANEKWVPGRWIQVTFGARIKDEYRSIEELKKLKAEVDGKNRSWEKDNTDKQAPDAKTITYANGDLGLVAALINEVGEDPVIWAIPGPSRLFARTSRGDYYATPMGDKQGNSWQLIEKDGSDENFGKNAWINADSRYNGRSPYSDDSGVPIDLDSFLLNNLKTLPKIVGHKLIKGAEGGSRLFVQTEDANKNTHIFTTPNEDKSGATWYEITSANGDVYNNAINRLTPDSGTIRMLDLVTTTTTLNGDSANWPVISEEKHEGMANQGTYNVVFGNGAKGTYKTNTVTVNPEAEELEVTKIWKNAGKDELPSPENFKEFLILKANGKDVTKQYADRLTVTDNKDFTYTAKWTGLPKLKNVNYSYEVDEKPMPGFVTEIDGTIITNTKTREEKPEIEKYVNQAVHKDITLDEVFTYDIIAYITKDADSFTITDKLNDVLCFAHKAEDVKVADLGEANNHLVTNNISAVKVNDNASVAGAGTPITGADVNINGQSLTVSLSNKMKPVTEDYDPVKIESIDPYDKGYYEKTTEDIYVKTNDTNIDSNKTYYAMDGSGSYKQVENPTNDDLGQYYELTQVTKYVPTQDNTPDPGKTYYREEGGDYKAVTITSVDPKAEGYYEKSGESFVKTNDTKADPAKTYYIRVKITDGSRGYEYDGDVQPVTALRGHWVKVTFRARIKPGLKLSDVKKAFSTIKNDQEEDRAPENKGNAPVVSGENHKGIPNDAAYTIGVAGEAGIKEGVYGDRSNTVTVKPSDNSGSDGDDSDEGDSGNKDGDKKSPGKSQGADTGDHSPLTLFLILPVVSALALLALRRRY